MGKWLDRERWRYINSPEFEEIQATYLRVFRGHLANQLSCRIYGLGDIPEWEVDPETYAKCVKYASHYGWAQPKVSGVPVVARK